MKGGTGNIVIKNKKASHDYEFLENQRDAYCRVLLG